MMRKKESGERPRRWKHLAIELYTDESPSGTIVLYFLNEMQTEEVFTFNLSERIQEQLAIQSSLVS